MRWLAALLESRPTATRRPIRFAGEPTTAPLLAFGHGDDAIPVPGDAASA